VNLLAPSSHAQRQIADFDHRVRAISNPDSPVRLGIQPTVDGYFPMYPARSLRGAIEFRFPPSLRGNAPQDAPATTPHIVPLGRNTYGRTETPRSPATRQTPTGTQRTISQAVAAATRWMQIRHANLGRSKAQNGRPTRRSNAAAQPSAIAVSVVAKSMLAANEGCSTLCCQLAYRARYQSPPKNSCVAPMMGRLESDAKRLFSFPCEIQKLGSSPVDGSRDLSDNRGGGVLIQTIGILDFQYRRLAA
jgi:hypothetical protein